MVSRHNEIVSPFITVHCHLLYNTTSLCWLGLCVLAVCGAVVTMPIVSVERDQLFAELEETYSMLRRGWGTQRGEMP